MEIETITYKENLKRSRIREMKPLYNGAKETGLWFHIRTLDGSEFWFSPDELIQLHKEGKHLYTPQLWTLCDPMLKVRSMEKRIEIYTHQLETFKARIK